MASNLFKPRLDAIMKNPDNATCADCDARGPRWSSVKLGILICPQCAGIHRKLGTHISFVQSVTIDKWKPEWVDLCERIGNKVSNTYFESKVPEHIKKPSPSDTGAVGGDTIDSLTAAKLEKWIRNKYELKIFANPDLVEPKQLISENKDPRVEYGLIDGSPSEKKKHRRKKQLSLHNDLDSLSPASQLEASPQSLPEPKIVLPVDFDWRQNIFIASWARLNGIDVANH